MQSKVALITGVTGQDGSYLSRLLLQKGYAVHGLIRRASLPNTSRIDDLIAAGPDERDHFILHDGDLTDGPSLIRLLEKVRPTEVYNLGAQSHVAASFDSPEYTANTDALGTLRILEGIRILGLGAHTRFYQASTSELFGKVQEIPQNERTPFYPRSPYAAAKLFAYWTTVNYREAYGLHSSNGILFNHESPLRGVEFVTRKITRAAVAIHLGRQEVLHLGNLDARRDWGHARDYVEGMWRIVQQDTADDYVLGTGEMHSVRRFAEMAFAHLGRPLAWRGKAVQETGIDTTTGRTVIRVSPDYFRPAEVEQLLADPTKAKNRLGWQPTVGLAALVAEMVDADLVAMTA